MRTPTSNTRLFSSGTAVGLALLLTTALPVAACGGDEDPVQSDCRRACEAAAACAGGSVDLGACLSYCADTVYAAGEYGAFGIQLCANCMETSTCGEVASGDCGQVCGDGSLVQVPPQGGCMETWQEDNHTYQVSCEVDEDDGNLYCECAEDGLVGWGFESTNFCGADTPAQQDQANRGCGWEVGLWKDCHQQFEHFEYHPGIECVGTTTGWECQCHSYGGPTDADFYSEDFCDLDLDARILAANDHCGFDLDGGVPCHYSWAYSAYFEVSCDGGTCQCTRDQVDGLTFSSTAFCAVGYEDKEVIAEAECGWTIQ